MSRNDVFIRKAEAHDLDAVKSLADANRYELGFVRRSTLAAGIQKGWLIVAEYRGRVIGFVNFRHRQDAQTTIYEICVASDMRRKGVGRALIRWLAAEAATIGKTKMCLRAPTDLSANAFYSAVGLISVDVENGKARQLNVWEGDPRKMEHSL